MPNLVRAVNNVVDAPNKRVRVSPTGGNSMMADSRPKSFASSTVSDRRGHRVIEVPSQLIGPTPAVRVLLTPLLVLLTAVAAEAAVPGAPGSVAVYSIDDQKLEVRWSSSDYAATTESKVQWKSGTQEYDASRQASADPATSAVTGSSSKTSDGTST